MVSFFDAAVAADNTAVGKSWSRQLRHHLFDGGVGIVDHEHRRFDKFGRLCGGMFVVHPDGDAGRTIAKKVRELRGKTVGSFFVSS